MAPWTGTQVSIVSYGAELGIPGLAAPLPDPTYRHIRMHSTNILPSTSA